MPRLEEVFNTKELINYYKEREVAPMLSDKDKELSEYASNLKSKYSPNRA